MTFASTVIKRKFASVVKRNISVKIDTSPLAMPTTCPSAAAVGAMTNGVGGWRVERTPMVRVLVRQVKQFPARLAARGAFVTAKGLTAFSSQ